MEEEAVIAFWFCTWYKDWLIVFINKNSVFLKKKDHSNSISQHNWNKTCSWRPNVLTIMSRKICFNEEEFPVRSHHQLPHNLILAPDASWGCVSPFSMVAAELLLIFIKPFILREKWFEKREISGNLSSNFKRSEKFVKTNVEVCLLSFDGKSKSFIFET